MNRELRTGNLFSFYTFYLTYDCADFDFALDAHDELAIIVCEPEENIAHRLKYAIDLDLRANDNSVQFADRCLQLLATKHVGSHE